MKRQHTYERMIGNKLNGLTPPDVAGLWNSMEAILDKEMPQQEEKKRGFGAWWNNTSLLAAASLLVLVGGVYTVRQLSGHSTVAEANTAIVGTNNSRPVSAPAVTTATVNVPSGKEVAAVNNRQEEGVNRAAVSGTTIYKSSTSATAIVSSGSKKEESNSVKRSGEVADLAIANRTDNEVNVAGAEVKNLSAGEEVVVNESAVKEVAPIEVSLPNAFSLQEVNALTAAQVNVAIGKKKKQKVYVDKGVAAGVSLNYPFALNSQVKNNLDTKGQNNKWQDYLPSVYAQFHLSKKFYLQAEWQPVAAQYTPNFTLYRSIVEPSPDEKEEKVVKLNKLFYTNVPVSFHYNTPLKNVTVGVGVQYALLKKIILQDQEYYHLIGPGRWDITERKNEVAVKDPNEVREHTNAGDVVDSVARAFRKEDLRLMADVSYRYKGFNLGARYTKSMNNYINSNFTNLPVKARNEGLQIYLRYNLFDSRKK